MSDKQLYASVRAGFISQHTSLNKWCKAHGIHRQNARDALLGIWTGDGANAIRARLIEASGIDCRSSENLTATLTATNDDLSQFVTD
jgi:hypothetical protein